MSREIELTQGQGAIVDDEDFERVKAYAWRARWSADTGRYFAEADIPDGGNRKCSRLYLHRFILGLSGQGQAQSVVFKNGNSLDYRKSNLMVTERGRKQRLASNNTTGYKGVSWNKRSKKHLANIDVNGKRLYLGSFDDPVNGALAYDDAARKAFGPLARLNFPLPGELKADDPLARHPNPRVSNPPPLIAQPILEVEPETGPLAEPSSDNGTVKIGLTQGQFAWVDAEDFWRVEPYRWIAHWRDAMGAYFAEAWILDPVNGKRRLRPLHRFILGLPKGSQAVVFRNGNALDCRRANLLITLKGRKQRLGSRNTSTFKGVCWQRVVGRWAAYISVNGRTRYLGLFNDEVEAALAYDRAAREVYGPLARLNFPGPGELPARTVQPLKPAA